MKLEIESAAETFAESQSPGAVDACAKGSVQDELLAAGFVEETLGDDELVRRHGAERSGSGAEIGSGLAFEFIDIFAHG